MRSGRSLTRNEVLEWRSGWSNSDRLMIAGAMDAVPDVEFILVETESHIGAWTAAGQAFRVSPGYLLFPGRKRSSSMPPNLFPDMLEDAQGHFHLLSTFDPWTPGPRQLAEAQCPGCFVMLPASGICDCG